MPFLTPRRVDTPELLDEHDAPRDQMERSLRDLRWINRQWGGVAVYLALLRRLIPARAPKSVLDLGTGTSDLLEALDGVPLRIGLDFNLAHLLYRPPGTRTAAKIHRVLGDARRLPFRDGSVEAITSAHFFHHFSPDENEAMLAEMLRVASIGVAVNDTRRHRAPLLFMQIVGALRLVGPITRYDGAASVRRGYTVGEARAIAKRIRCAKAAVLRAWPFRFGIVLWK